MKKVGYKELIVYRQEELWNRLSRFVRVIYSFYQSPIISDFREGLNNFVGTNLMPDILVGADDYKIEGGHNPEDRWARLAAQSTQGESRTEIIRKTYKLIQDRPQGWWPKSYSNEIDFFCNSNMKCQYPHNILLETSFYFGFILGLAYLFALILLSLNLLKVVIFGTNPLLTGISVVILIHLFGAQFTGTFYDLVVTGFLLLVFGLFVSRSSDSEVGI